MRGEKEKKGVGDLEKQNTKSDVLRNHIEKFFKRKKRRRIKFVESQNLHSAKLKTS